MLKDIVIKLEENKKVITGTKAENEFTIVSDMEYITDDYGTHKDSYWESKKWESKELNDAEINEVFKQIYIKYNIGIY